MKKNVFSLIIKLLLLAIPVAALSFYALMFPMYYMPSEYPMWQQEKDFIEGRIDSDEKADADVLILGDSRAKSGIIPSELCDDKDVSIYNMAIGGATPIEMYYALKTYLSNHSAPSRIVIIFAPYHFCFMDNWGQTLSYNYLSLSEFTSVYFNALLKGETDMLSAGTYIDMLSYKLRLPNKYMNSIYEARLYGRYDDNTSKYNAISESDGYTEFGTKDGDDGLNYDTHYDWFDDSKLVDMYFDRLLALCKDNNIELIYVQSPINEASSEVMYAEFVRGYNKIISRMMKKYGFAYEKKELPSYDNSYFGDANHLNNTGAHKFTAEVKEKYFDGYTVEK